MITHEHRRKMQERLNMLLKPSNISVRVKPNADGGALIEGRVPGAMITIAYQKNNELAEIESHFVERANKALADFYTTVNDPGDQSHD